MTQYVLPSLPYDFSALQPWIDEQTMRIHHGYHHLRHVDGLNTMEGRLTAARERGDFSLIPHLQSLAAMHAAGHFLHSLFWEVMGPDQGGQPREDMGEQIREDFGSFAAFKSQFSAAATNLESGGWVVLGWQPTRQQLQVVAVDNQREQASWGIDVLLALDVWEHAYYLKYQNRRAEYVHNWWNIVNWPRVAQSFTAARLRSSAPRGRWASHTSATNFGHKRRAELQAR